MTLEDVVRAGNMYLTFLGFASQYVDRTGNLKVTPSNENLSQVIDNLLYNLPEDARAMAQERIRTNPGILPGMINENLNGGKASLISSSRDNYQGIIAALDARDLQQIANIIPDENKKYVKILRKLAEAGEREGKPYSAPEVVNALTPEDIEAIKQDYAETFDNPAWKKFIQEQDADFIKKYAFMYTNHASQKFIGDNLCTESVEEGRKVKRPNEEKMRDYIGGHLTDEAYLDIGKLYSAKILSAMREAQKKARKEA